MDLFILITAGLVGGFIGAQSGGGGMITLPALLFLGFTTGSGIATNIVSGWVINVVATLRYCTKGFVNLRLALPYALIAMGGSFIGSQTVLSIDETVLNPIVAALFLGLLAVILLRPNKRAQSIHACSVSTPWQWFGYTAAFALGFYGGFFLLGVTTLFAFLFILLYSCGFLQAVAQAVFIASFALIPSVIVFALSGAMQYEEALILAGSSVIGSIVGANTALKLGERWIMVLLTTVIIASIVRLVVFA